MNKSLFSVFDSNLDTSYDFLYSTNRKFYNPSSYYLLDTREYINLVIALYESVSIFRSCVDITASEVTSSEPSRIGIAKMILLYGNCFIHHKKVDSTWQTTILDPRYVRLRGDKNFVRYQVPGQSSLELSTSYNPSEWCMLVQGPCFGRDIFAPAFIKPCLLAASTLFNLDVLSHRESNVGFMPSALVSLNNGTPSDEDRRDIEDLFNSKFSQGGRSAGSVILSFSEDKDHAPEVQTISTDSYCDKFAQAHEQAEKTVLSCFHITPALLGLYTKDASGSLSEIEYQAQYALFQKFTVDPLKEIIM